MFRRGGRNPRTRTPPSDENGIHCSGTLGSFNNHGTGSQDFTGATINSGEKSGLNLKGSSEKGNASRGGDDGVSRGHFWGTQSSFCCGNGKCFHNFKDAVINSDENSGSCGGSGSARAPGQQHGVTGTLDSFNTCQKGSHDFTRAKVNSGANSGSM